MSNCFPTRIATGLCALSLIATATSLGMAQANSCPDGSRPQLFSVTAEAEGLENSKRAAARSLDNLLSRNGVVIGMVDVQQHNREISLQKLEPQCLFTEVGNNVQCVAEAEICP